jgi:SAM-dependent methyltransferase
VDDVARYNKQRWEALVQANVLYSRPWLDLDRVSARQRLGIEGFLGDVCGQRALLLASGGGQQSAAFALLGAEVTVLDLAEGQLERDRSTAEHYGLAVKTVQGDMRDLSPFEMASFDVVYHPYSINYVPDAATVIREVARVLRPGGLYSLGFHNPYALGVQEMEWDGRGYPLRHEYVDGEVAFADPEWVVEYEDGTSTRFPAPRMFRHTFSSLLNGLVANGFVLLSFTEEQTWRDFSAPPGTWEHFLAVSPPYLSLWAALRPDVVPYNRVN